MAIVVERRGSDDTTSWTEIPGGQVAVQNTCSTRPGPDQNTDPGARSGVVVDLWVRALRGRGRGRGRAIDLPGCVAKKKS